MITCPFWSSMQIFNANILTLSYYSVSSSGSSGSSSSKVIVVTQELRDGKVVSSTTS